MCSVLPVHVMEKTHRHQMSAHCVFDQCRLIKTQTMARSSFAETLVYLQYLFKYAFNHLFSRFSEREYICVCVPEKLFYLAV